MTCCYFWPPLMFKSCARSWRFPRHAAALGSTPVASRQSDCTSKTTRTRSEQLDTLPQEFPVLMASNIQRYMERRLDFSGHNIQEVCADLYMGESQPLGSVAALDSMAQHWTCHATAAIEVPIRHLSSPESGLIARAGLTFCDSGRRSRHVTPSVSVCSQGTARRLRASFQGVTRSISTTGMRTRMGCCRTTS